MRHVYARCMDGHYFVLTDGVCPMDGSPSGGEAIGLLPDLEEVSLAALASAGLSPEDLAVLAIVELPDGEAAPEMLYPR